MARGSERGTVGLQSHFFNGRASVRFFGGPPFLLGKNSVFSVFPELFHNNHSANSREFAVFYKVVPMEVSFSRELSGFMG
jgi:hypothetical protein